jgi:hypothetical protein
MDIRNLVIPSAAQELELKGPDKEKSIGLKLSIRSAESDEVKQATRAHSNKFLSSKKKKLTAEKLEDEYLDKAAAAIAAWDWSDNPLDLDLDGDKNPPLTPENARALVEVGWIYEQVAEFSEDRENFIKPSQKGSAKR